MTLAITVLFTFTLFRKVTANRLKDFRRTRNVRSGSARH
jgi:hypothetical protein